MGLHGTAIMVHLSIPSGQKKAQLNFQVASMKVVWNTLQYIYKEEMIPKSDYKYGFKKFKIYIICTKNAFLKFDKRVKK